MVYRRVTTIKSASSFSADYDWADISDSGSRTLHSEFNIPGEPGFGITTNMIGQEKLDSLATVRARLGITPVERGLIYATGGLAFGHASSSIAVSQIETGPTCPGGITFTPSSGSASGIRTGWTAGVGGEWAAWTGPWGAVTFKLEYLHADFDSKQYFNPPVAIPTGTIVTRDMKLRDDMVRVGMNVLFNWGGPVIAKY